MIPEHPSYAIYLNSSRGVVDVEWQSRDLEPIRQWIALFSDNSKKNNDLGAHVLTTLKSPGYVGLTEVKEFERMFQNFLAEHPDGMGEHADKIKAIPK